MRRSALLLFAAGLMTGCGGLRQPPLPQGAATAATPAPAREGAWAERLRRADNLYFSLTKRAADEEPAWQVLDLLQRSGARVALGWAEIPAREQPVLERWQAQQISTEQLLAEIVRPERSEALREGLRAGLAQVALGASRSLLGKIRSGEPLDENERGQLPRAFHPREDAFEIFAEHVNASPRLRHFNLRALYQAHLVAEQTIAENIVRFRRAQSEVKLLVLLPNDTMIDPREVADFAAQKMPLQQLILDRADPLQERRGQLLAEARDF